MQIIKHDAPHKRRTVISLDRAIRYLWHHGLDESPCCIEEQFRAGDMFLVDGLVAFYRAGK